MNLFFFFKITFILSLINYFLLKLFFKKENLLIKNKSKKSIKEKKLEKGNEEIHKIQKKNPLFCFQGDKIKNIFCDLKRKKIYLPLNFNFNSGISTFIIKHEKKHLIQIENNYLLKNVFYYIGVSPLFLLFLISIYYGNFFIFNVILLIYLMFYFYIELDANFFAYKKSNKNIKIKYLFILTSLSYLFSFSLMIIIFLIIQTILIDFKYIIN